MRAMTLVGPKSSLYQFQPVKVASGTASCGVCRPSTSFPSAFTCGTMIGNAGPTSGGSLSMMPSVQNRGP
jgi:hypothetical protein